jgi:hypothetical protein
MPVANVNTAITRNVTKRLVILPPIFKRTARRPKSSHSGAKMTVVRLGRIILASLATLAAYSYAQSVAESPCSVAADSLPRLFHSVVPLLASAVDSIAPAHVEKSSPHAVFALDALTATPLCGSICLVASATAINILARRHQRALLRC